MNANKSLPLLTSRPLAASVMALMCHTALLAADPTAAPTPTPAPIAAPPQPALTTPEATPAADATPAPAPAGVAPATPAPPTQYRMDPVLMKRYGLLPTTPPPPPPPAPQPQTASPAPYQMDPVLMKRYGLTPPTPAPVPVANTPEELLKRGLFEEEANRRPEQAAAQYEEVVRLHDAQRRNAATALFRLAECRRKLALTNDAVLAYQRLLRDFSDQTDLIELAGPRLNDLQSIPIPSRSIPKSQPRGVTPLPPPGASGMGATPTIDPVTGLLSGGGVPHVDSPRIFLPPLLAALDPSELPELERQLAFIESKRSQSPELFTSAIRLVFSTDGSLARLEKAVHDLTHTIATSKVYWDEADANVKRYSDMLLEAKTNLADIERKDAGNSKPSLPEIDIAVKRVGNIQSVLDDFAAKASGRGYYERLLDRQRKELSARREQLVRATRLKAELLRALQSAPTFEGRLETSLQHLRAARNPADRSELILMTLADESLRGLWTRLASEEEKAIELQAKAPSGDSPDASALKTVELSLASFRHAIVEREDELLRKNELSLELARARARDDAGSAPPARF